MDDDSETKKLDKLIKYFSTRKVKVSDNNAPKYYGGPLSADQVTVAGPCKGSDGTCAAWMSLFMDAAKNAGLGKDGTVSMQSVGILPPNPNFELIVVGKDWTINGTPLKDRKDFPKTNDATIGFPKGTTGFERVTGLWKAATGADGFVNNSVAEAQNTMKPTTAIFLNHAIVLVRADKKTYLFDPSYGKKSAEFDVDAKMSIRDIVKDTSAKKALANYESANIGGIVWWVQKGKVINLKAMSLSSDGMNPVLQLVVDPAGSTLGK